MTPIDAIWQELLEKDDRTSPAQYPDMVLISHGELADLLTRSGDDDDHMVKIEKLIADMQSIKDRFGNTCVYIRRGGLSWGAVALNRRDDDQKRGVFDLQEQHDRSMHDRLEQIGRLKDSRDTAEAEVRRLKVELAATRLRVTGLEHVAQEARSAIDRHLGDSDPPNGSDDPLFIVCRRLSALLESAKTAATMSGKDGSAAS